MRYTVRRSVIWVLGVIWMPMVPASQVIELRDYDIGNMRDDDGKITRESVDRWLAMNAGDFSSITDFRASIEDGDQTIDIEWASEDSDLAYSDTLPQEE
jgi:hypothetical protein